MYINIEVTRQVNVEAIIIVIVKKRIVISLHESIEEDKHVKFHSRTILSLQMVNEERYSWGWGEKPPMIDSD